MPGTIDRSPGRAYVRIRQTGRPSASRENGNIRPSSKRATDHGTPAYLARNTHPKYRRVVVLYAIPPTTTIEHATRTVSPDDLGRHNQIHASRPFEIKNIRILPDVISSVIRKNVFRLPRPVMIVSFSFYRYPPHTHPHIIF